ncbi:hypothetical protein SLE2022_111270 [Rubroshorea leprosula]
MHRSFSRFDNHILCSFIKKEKLAQIMSSRDSKKADENENRKTAMKVYLRAATRMANKIKKSCTELGHWPTPANPSIQRPGCCQAGD